MQSKISIESFVTIIDFKSFSITTYMLSKKTTIVNKYIKRLNNYKACDLN